MDAFGQLDWGQQVQAMQDTLRQCQEHLDRYEQRFAQFLNHSNNTPIHSVKPTNGPVPHVAEAVQLLEKADAELAEWDELIDAQLARWQDWQRRFAEVRQQMVTDDSFPVLVYNTEEH